MNYWLQSVSRISQICARRVAVRHYIISPRQKWSLEGVPRPRSILEDDDTVIDLSEDNEVVNGANPNTPPPHIRCPSRKRTPREHVAHRETMRKDFPQGWAPPRKISREAMDAVRRLHRLDPEKFSTPMIADKFKISPEAVRRILKSKWEPSSERRAAIAIKERKQRDEVRQKRRLKESSETEELRELRKTLRNLNDHVWDMEQNREPAGRGIGPTDRFTFR